MIRWMFAVLLCFFATNSFSQDIRVVVDEQDHFVIHGEATDLLGFQFESASGSLIPGDIADFKPFQFYLTNEPTVVTFGSLTESVSLSGSLKLSTRWNAAGQKDVGFLWGNFTDDGWGTVEGHEFVFEEPQRGSAVSPFPTEDDSDVTINISDNEPIKAVQPPEPAELAPPITVGAAPVAFIDLDPTDPLQLYFQNSPEIHLLTISSDSGLLEYEFLPPVGAGDDAPLALVSQDAFSASFVPTGDIADGNYVLPLSWSGDDRSDLDIAVVSAMDATVFAEVIQIGTTLPEPAGLTLLIPALCLLPALRVRKRRA